MQPSLFPAVAEKDDVETPTWLAKKVVSHFRPEGMCLDPCRGSGVFYRLLPESSEWCEIKEGRDFFAWDRQVDWAIGNPPYSILLEWIRHSFEVADNIVYLMPLHRVFASYSFLLDVNAYGGIEEIGIIGTGTDAGFPFGHCLGAVHYKRNQSGKLKWAFI